MGLLSKALTIQVVTGQSGGLLRRLTIISREIESGAFPDGAEKKSEPSEQVHAIAGQSRPESPLVPPAHKEPVESNGPLPRPHATEHAGGLLKKSFLFLKVEREESPESESLLVIDYTPAIERLRRDIERLASDFSFFPDLYRLLGKDLRLSRSAFFLTGGASILEFKPWMHRGLDPALVPALTFTEGLWTEHARRSPSTPYLLGDSRQLFPRLARALPGPLFMLPFEDNGALAGSLLMSQAGVSPESRASLFALFSALSQPVGSAVALRLRGYTELARPETAYRTPLETLAACLAGENGIAGFFSAVSISLEPFFDTLEKKFEFFDRPTLRETLLRVTNASLNGLGTGTALGRDEILVVTRGNGLMTPKLFASFLTRLLKEFFKGLFDNAPPLLATGAVDYPACGADRPETILACLRP